MSKKYKDGITPIVLGINKNRQVVSGNPNIILDIVKPSSSGFNIAYTFTVNSSQNYFMVYFKDIVNKITTGENVASVIRDISDSQDDYLNPSNSSNPAYIFFPGYSTITSFTVTWKYANGSLNNMIFKLPHPELTTVTAFYNIRSLHAGISPSQDVSYLPKLRMFSGTYTSALKGLQALTRLYVNVTFNSTINDEFSQISNFPELRQLSGLIIGLDLRKFWNGNPNRMSVNMGDFAGTSVTYTGGANFPQVISDGGGFNVDFIYYHGINTGTKLTGTALSRFLIDFANKVTSVTSVNKKMQFSGSTYDSAYEDPDTNKPIRTALAAITKITGSAATSGLGITLSFS
ncbi:hypothetical protein [Epilithonimonas sp. UC225_85]|uniref:hypothetical protein n=1 Tax=Epilithonimonas sp. UC225_85 TaxID=3350167 RepID=UPI0036D39578